MPKFIIKRKQDAEPAPDAPVEPEPIPVADTFRPHPVYQQFYACENTGRIEWRKSTGITKLKHANKFGYLDLRENGHQLAHPKQTQFIADIFKPKPQTTTRMERRSEEWIIKISDDYNESDWDGYIPPRFLSWVVADKSRRKTKLSQNNDDDDTQPQTPPARNNDEIQKLKDRITALEETIESIRSDRDGLLRVLQRTRDEILDHEKDELKKENQRLKNIIQRHELPSEKSNIHL